MTDRAGIQAASPPPARPCPPPARSGQHDGHHNHDGHPADDRDAGLDAYVARLAAQAPPLTSGQRDTLALLLRRPRYR
jgi:hypothetical protein